MVPKLGIRHFPAQDLLSEICKNCRIVRRIVIIPQRDKCSENEHAGQKQQDRFRDKCIGKDQLPERKDTGAFLCADDQPYRANTAYDQKNKEGLCLPNKCPGAVNHSTPFHQKRSADDEKE